MSRLRNVVLVVRNSPQIPCNKMTSVERCPQWAPSVCWAREELTPNAYVVDKELDGRQVRVDVDRAAPRVVTVAHASP